MQIKFCNKGNTLIASIMGELDHHSAEYFREKIDGELLKSSTRNIIFDFSKVSFMDSSGIGMVIGRFKYVQKLYGKAAIVEANDQISRVFKMSGVLKLIPLYDNIDIAMKAM